MAAWWSHVVVANTKGRCAGCKQYFPREELTKVGLSGVCSDDCKRDLLARHKTKVQHREQVKTHRRRGVSSDLRERIRNRDHNVCRVCSHVGYRMEIHHIRYRSQGGEDWVTNLIFLCDKHHALVHSNKRYWQPILLATLWLHYVDGVFLTVPQVEKWLISKGLL